MVLIELTQSTHFDLVELLSELKRDYYGFIENYDTKASDKELDIWTKEALQKEETKAMYAKCVDKCKKIDVIIAELKQEPTKHKHKECSIIPFGNGSIMLCEECKYTEYIHGDPRHE